VRRERSLTETLLSITLGLEAAMMFFASLVVFGLDRLDPDWLALVYGAVFIVVLVIAAALQRYTWGVWFGAVLQLAIIATGLLEPMKFLVGAAFLALWVYSYERGPQIDRQKAAWLGAQASGTPSPATSPEGDTP
jgi:cell division protein FtsW (lipid II flippase)